MWIDRRCLHIALMIGAAASAGALSAGGPAPSKAADAAPSPVRAGAGAFVERWMEVRINGVPIPHPARLLQLPGGELYASGEDLARWRIRPPAVEPLSARGRDHYPLGALDGLGYRIDERTQTLELSAPGALFAPTVINARSAAYTPPDPSSAGGFLNYDLQYQRQDGARRLDGLVEVGVFNRWGFGTSTFLGRDVSGVAPVVRLETAWTHDRPDDLRSLRVGDSISRSGPWARSVHFGGIQWGSDFATRPDFVAFPLPTTSGEALMPSTVDLYVDNALRLSRSVPPGPFTIPDVPVVTGEGQVRLVVRDILGREQVILQPYQANATLLREGLHDYTYEAGFVRRNFGLASNDYGPFFLAGTHRVGLSERFTGELRGELRADRQTAGVGGSYLWPGVGILNAAVAASRSPAGQGALASLGIERQARPLSFAWQATATSAGFVQLGTSEDREPPSFTSLARVSYAAGGAGAVFASHVRQVGRTEPTVEFVSAGYSVPLFGRYYLSLFALRSLAGERSTSLGVTLTYSPGPRTTASASWNHRKGDSGPGVQVQQSLPYGPGFGYRLAADGGAQPRQEAALFARGEVGTYGLEMARIDGTEAQRLTASGGVAFLGGGLHLSRRLDDSFAVVKVGEYPSVPIYVDNQLIARTGANGAALVPALRPYQANSISIDQDGLPLDARVGALRMPVSLSRRSGRVVEFPVRSSRGALLRIVLEDGAPLPSGAVVRIKGRDEEFPVALRGEAYVTGLAEENELEASWKGRRCPLRATLPRSAGPLPVLGPLVCRGVRP